MCKCCTPTRFVSSGFLLLVLCIGFICMAIFLPPWIDSKLDSIILDTRRVITSNRSEGYESWSSNYYDGAPPQYLKVYVFNVTNPAAVLSGSEVPHLQQVGPYVYEWKWYLFDVSFHPDGLLVDMFKADYFIFDQNLSGTLNAKNDKFTFPALPYAGIRYTIGEASDDQWWQSLGFDILASIAGGEQGAGVPANDVNPFITASVDNYVWGYSSPLLYWVNSTLVPLLKNQSNIDPIFRLQKNSTSEEYTRRDKKYPDTMYTGKNSTHLLNNYYKWQGMTHLYNGEPIWNSEEANRIMGGDGLGFDIHINGFETQQLFVENIFRHFDFISNQTTTVKDIPMNIYFLDEASFGNVNTNPAYELFAPPGLCNLTKINRYTQGAPVPVFVSQPFFYGSDPYYLDQVKFLPPNTGPIMKDHNTFIYVEPRTGLTMQAFKRIQINLQMKPSFLHYPFMKEAFVPVMWIEEGGSINDNLANQWKSSVGLVLTLLEAIPLISYCIAGLMALIGGSLFVLAYTRQSRHEYGRIDDDTIQNS